MSLVEFRVPSSLESIWRFLLAICAEPHNSMWRQDRSHSNRFTPRTILSPVEHDNFRLRAITSDVFILMPFCIAPPLLASTTERVTDRDTIANRMARTEFHIVVYEVQSHLRPNKEISVRVEANASAEIAHKMAAAHVIGAVPVIITVVIAGVEADALCAYSRQRLSPNVLAEAPAVDRIKVVKQWPVGDLAAIQALARLPVHLGLHPHISMEERLKQNISIESYKCSTALSRQEDPTTADTAARGG